MAAKKNALGKGLDSMIPLGSMNVFEDENVSRETFVKTNKIEPNRLQPRRNFDEDSLQELSESIKEHGIIQPIILQKRQDYYEIIAGERRWRAAKLAGIKEVPAIIKDYNEKEILEISLIENIQRENLNPIEEAIAYKRLIDEFNLKQDEIAERVSKSRVTITNAIRLLKLDNRVQEMIVDGLITSGHGRTLISIDNHDKQYYLANKIFDEKLSVREAERLIKTLDKEKNEEVKKENLSHTLLYKEIEEKVKSILGTKVVIKRKTKEKGKIEIEYYSDDELERIIELFESIS